MASSKLSARYCTLIGNFLWDFIRKIPKDYIHFPRRFFPTDLSCAYCLSAVVIVTINVLHVCTRLFSLLIALWQLYKYI